MLWDGKDETQHVDNFRQEITKEMQAGGGGNSAWEKACVVEVAPGQLPERSS